MEDKDNFAEFLLCSRHTWEPSENLQESHSPVVASYISLQLEQRETIKIEECWSSTFGKEVVLIKILVLIWNSVKAKTPI